MLPVTVWKTCQELFQLVPERARLPASDARDGVRRLPSHQDWRHASYVAQGLGRCRAIQSPLGAISPDERALAAQGGLRHTTRPAVNFRRGSMLENFEQDRSIDQCLEAK